jgi:hypothetical protein
MTRSAPISIAGRTIDAGDVKVCNDDTNLTFTYEATYPWCLLETNLHVATIPDPPADPDANIPQNKPGNPIPGHFDQGDEHDCVGTATFEIPLDEIDGGVSPGDTVVIAAHAEVEDGKREEGAWGKGPRFVERGNWAMYFTYTVQAPPPATSCFCDSQMAPGGTTGAEILAQLCPDGAVISGVTVDDGGGVTSLIFNAPFLGLTLFYGAIARDPPAPSSCTLGDVFGEGQSSFLLSPTEAEACQAHLRVSCSQNWPF